MSFIGGGGNAFRMVDKEGLSITTSEDGVCQSIGAKAREEGYTVIKVQSYRGDGINYIIFDNFDKILSPRIVVPVDERSGFVKMINLIVEKEVVWCRECHRKVPFFYISDFAYGERLPRYDKGKYFYFNFFRDEVYHGFYKEAEELGRVLGIPLDYEQIHHIFSITIDPIDGHSIDIQAYDNRCPYCGSTRYEDIIAQPREDVPIEVPVVTHERWNTLSAAQQQELLRAAIEDLK